MAFPPGHTMVVKLVMKLVGFYNIFLGKLHLR